MKPAIRTRDGVEMSEDLLSAFVDDALNERERGEVIERLCHDPQWRRRYEHYLLIGAALRRDKPLLAPGVLSVAVTQALLAAQDGHAAKAGKLQTASHRLRTKTLMLPARLAHGVWRSVGARHHSGRGMAAAAVLLVLVTGAGYLGFPRGEYRTADNGLPRGVMAEVRPGAQDIRPVSANFSGNESRPLVFVPSAAGDASGVQRTVSLDSEYLVLGDEGNALEWHTLLDPNTLLTGYAVAMEPSPQQGATGDASPLEAPGNWSGTRGEAAPRITRVGDR